MSMTSCFFLFFYKNTKNKRPPGPFAFKKNKRSAQKNKPPLVFLKLAILHVNLYHVILNDIHTWNINVTWVYETNTLNIIPTI